MSRFGTLVKKSRFEKKLTLEKVAKAIGSHKGYVSGIENGKVNPPSIRIIKKYAKLFGQDFRTLARIAWVDKAPEVLREDAEKFLRWCELGCPLPEASVQDERRASEGAKSVGLPKTETSTNG